MGRIVTHVSDREMIAGTGNPLGMDGIEFVEFSTSKPQALGQVLEMMGFRPIARHRSREVLLYRQGDMNIIVNAHAGGQAAVVATAGNAGDRGLALRVRDAAEAYRHAIERGAWIVPSQVEVMELNIPAIHGVGSSRIYFVDRYRDFSIYDVDFTLNPGVDPHPPALADLHWFGIVQYIGSDRMRDWTEFYQELFGFVALPDEQRYGILPKGRILLGPCGRFHLQLIDPKPGHFRRRAAGVAAARRLRHAGRARRRRRAPRARSRLRRVAGRAFRDARRADPGVSGRRDVRAGAR